MNSISPTVSVRDQSELVRSQAEAAKADVTTLDPKDLARYLHPPANTPYGLEYAYHLLGDVSRKTVLDLACGQGENSVALMIRGAYVIGMDISPELVEIARERRRLHFGNNELGSFLCVGSAYDTGLPDESVDVIFCAASIHHLEIPRAQREMLRVLKPGGFVVLKEPVRFSKMYAWVVRKFFPPRGDVSEFEHPLTQEELNVMLFPFRTECLRYFRLPFVALAARVFPFWPKVHHQAIKLSATMLEGRFWLEKYATEVVVRLVKA